MLRAVRSRRWALPPPGARGVVGLAPLDHSGVLDAGGVEAGSPAYERNVQAMSGLVSQLDAGARPPRGPHVAAASP